MPELPEVETIARGLARRVTGDVVDSVWLGQKKEPLKSTASEIVGALEQRRIAGVRRMGKHIVFDLERSSMARAPSPTAFDSVLVRTRAKSKAAGGGARATLGYLPADGSALTAVSTSTCSFSAGSTPGG